MSAVRRLVGPLLALLAVGLLGLAALVATGHLRLQPVLTGSMTPRYPVGTLVAVSPVASSSVAVGDVVMFVPPPPYDGAPVLHRVLSLEPSPTGTAVRTQGDANAAPDPWVLDLDSGGFSEVRAESVLAGRAVAVARGTLRGPGLLLWAGALLLVLAARARRRPVAEAGVHRAARTRSRAYVGAHVRTPVLPRPRAAADDLAGTLPR